MNIYETLEVLQTGLKAGNTESSDLLYKVNIETDPYLEFTKLTPLVLIEADRTEFTNAESGHVVYQDHYFSLTAVEKAQNLGFKEYKSNVNLLAKNTINKLLTITDENIHKIVPSELSHAEMTIGSLKTTGIVITVMVRTYWDDF